MTGDLVSRIGLTVTGEASAQKAAASLDRLAAANDEVVISLGKAEKIRERNEARIERLARRYDEEYRALRQIEQAQKELDRARAAGLSGTTAYDRALVGLQKAQKDIHSAQNDNAKSAGLLRHEWINLSRQGQDIATGLATGQSPFMILAQQGSQVYDVFSTSKNGAGAALREFGTVALRFALNPVTLLAGALGVAGYAAYQFAEQQNDLERALNGTGRAAGVTAERLREIAAARSNGLGVGEGIGLAGQFASAGIAGSNIKTLVSDALPFARAFGLDIEKAGDEISQIVSEPGLGAFEKRFGAVSFATKEMVRSLEASGRHIEAQTEKTRLFDEEVKKAKDTSSELEKIWRSIRNWATTPIAGLGRMASGPSLQEQLAAARGGFFNLRAQRNGDASSFPGESAAEARVRDLERQIQAEREKTAQAAREADLNHRSQIAGPIIDRLAPDASLLRGLKEQLDAVKPLTETADGLAKLGDRAGAARTVVEQLTYQIDNFQTAADVMRQDNALAVAGISARTYAQREAVAMEKARIQVLRETGDVTRAALAAENERAKMLAESARKVDELARTSSDNLRLSKMLPFDRRMAEIDIAERDFRRDNIPNAASPMAAQFNTAADAAHRVAGAFDALASKIGGAGGSGLPFFAGGRAPSGADPRGLSDFIRSEATRMGIDPNVALRVAGSEGLGSFTGDRGSSFGAFQLHRGGIAKGGNAVGGLGDDFFRQTGLDPSNPANERATITYALEAAKRMGWAPFHGAARAGIGRFEGIAANDNASLSARAGGAFNDQREAARFEAMVKPLQDANREIERQRAALQSQEAAFGRSTAEVARATKEQELLNQAQSQTAGPISDALRASVAATAENYGRLADETERFADKQRHLVENLDLVRGSARDSIGGIASDLLHGARAADALNSALERVADRLISLAADRAVEGIFGKTGSSTSTGILGGLIGSIFGGGGTGAVAPFANGGVMSSAGPLPLRRYAGGGIADSPQLALFGEGRRPEAYVPLPDGRRIPAVVDIRGLGGVLNAAQQRSVDAALAAARGSGNDNRGGTAAAAPVTVNLIGAPQGTQVKETTEQRGGRRIDVVIDERFAQAMGSPQGRESARANYGMTPQVARR